MDPVSLAFSIIPVIQVLYKVRKTIKKYRREFKIAKLELKMLERDVFDFCNLLFSANRALQELDPFTQSTETEHKCLRSIARRAEQLARSITKFLSEQKRLFSQGRGWFATLIQSIRAIRRRTAAQPDIALFKWRLLSNKGSLHLLVSVSRIRVLKKILEHTLKDSSASQEKQEALKEELQLAIIMIRSENSEMKSLKRESRKLKEAASMSPGEDQEIEQTLDAIDTVRQAVMEEVGTFDHDSSRSRKCLDRDVRRKQTVIELPRMQDYPPRHVPSHSLHADTSPATDESCFTANTTASDTDLNSDSSISASGTPVHFSPREPLSPPTALDVVTNSVSNPREPRPRTAVGLSPTGEWEFEGEDRSDDKKIEIIEPDVLPTVTSQVSRSSGSRIGYRIRNDHGEIEHEDYEDGTKRTERLRSRRGL